MKSMFVTRILGKIRKTKDTKIYDKLRNQNT